MNGIPSVKNAARIIPEGCDEMQTVTIASAKGGVGKSTFCANIGRIHSLHGKRVLLVDMDIGVRSLDILLGVAEKTVYNWGDIIKGNCDFRKALIEAANNLYLLPAPVDFAEAYTPEAFKNAIEPFKKDFDYILLDSPAGLEKGFLLSAAAGDSCIIISTPDSISIRAASFAAQSVRASGIANVRLVINKFNKKLHKAINVDYVIDTVGARLLGIIPEDAAVYNSVNGGKIPYDCKGNGALVRISRRMNGENIPFRSKNL